MSLNALAKAVSVSPSHMSRVENGERGLHINKMHAIAAALGVSVNDLLTNQATGYMPDLAPYTPPAGSVIARALHTSTQKMFRTLTGVMSEIGLAKGDLLVADMQELAASDLQTGDAVVAEIIPDSRKEPVLLLRQFIKPHLLSTNSLEQNSVPIHMVKENARIAGKVLM